MAIAYKSQGSGVSTETSGAALSPLCPATVDAGDILIAHVFWEGTTTTPSTPAGWTLLSGPHVIETTIARHWLFGKIADGSEDGAAVAFGNPAVTTQRAARIYSFSGRVSGTITDLVRGFAATSHANDPQMPTVTTIGTDSLAVALVAQNDDNTIGSATGESGGDWTEAVAEYTAALTPGLLLQIQTASMASPGTITGGTFNTTNDPVGVLGFEIRPVGSAAYTIVAAQGAYTLTGQAAALSRGRIMPAAFGSYTLTGQALYTQSSRQQGYRITQAEDRRVLENGDARVTEGFIAPISAATGTYTLTGQSATLKRALTLTAAQGSYALTGQAVIPHYGRIMPALHGTYALAGQSVAFKRTYTLAAAQGNYTLTGRAVTFVKARSLTAAQGSYALTGQSATLRKGRSITAAQGAYALTGQAVAFKRTYTLAANQGAYTLTGRAATLVKNRTLAANFGSYALTGQAAALLRGRTLAAAQGAYTVTGQAVTLRKALRITAAQGSYTLTGQSAALYKSGSLAMVADTGLYTLTGQAAIPFKTSTYSIAAESGSYVLTGFSVELTHVEVPDEEPVPQIPHGGARTSARVRMERARDEAPLDYARLFREEEEMLAMLTVFLTTRGHHEAKRI